MAGDNLFSLLAMVRAEMPEVPDAAWEKIKRMLSDAAAGERVYVPKHNKRNNLEIVAAAGEATSNQQLSKMLGVSVRRVRQLRRIA